MCVYVFGLCICVICIYKCRESGKWEYASNYDGCCIDLICCYIYSISRHRTRDAKNDEVLADTFTAAAAAEAIDEASTVLWREDAKAEDDDDQLKTGWQMDGVEVQNDVVEDADEEELMLQDEEDVAGVVGYKCISDCINGVYNGVRGYEEV